MRTFESMLRAAIVVIGGLVTSTILTLVVVTTLYRFCEERRVEA